MFPSHLGVTRCRLGMLASHLRITRHLICRVGLAGTTPGSGHFARVRFGLVSATGSHVPLISGLELVRVCSSVTCFCCLTFSCSSPLKITLVYVARFVSTLSGSRRSSDFFFALTLPGAGTLAINFGFVPDFVFTSSCSRSRRGPRSLCAGLALPRTFGLVERLDRIGVRLALVHRCLEILILARRLLT